MYQKAIIEGLTGDVSEKILSLKEIIKNHASSEYADDALMQLGDAYFEMDNVENAYVVFPILYKDTAPAQWSMELYSSLV